MRPSAIFKDGNLIGDYEEMGIGDRRKLAFVGHVAASLLLDSRYDFQGDPGRAVRPGRKFDDEGEDMGDTSVMPCSAPSKAFCAPAARIWRWCARPCAARYAPRPT